MASSQEDKDATRIVRSTLSKRGIDVTRADVRVTHGVCYIRGLVSIIKGVQVSDLKTEMEHAARTLRQKPEIRDVVLECVYR